MDSFFVAGQRKDYVHHGLDLHGVASVRVQLEGNRVVVMALFDELQQFYNKTAEEEVCNGERCFFSSFVLLHLPVAIYRPNITYTILDPFPIEEFGTPFSEESVTSFGPCDL